MGRHATHTVSCLLPLASFPLFSLPHSPVQWLDVEMVAILRTSARGVHERIISFLSQELEPKYERATTIEIVSVDHITTYLRVTNPTREKRGQTRHEEGHRASRCGDWVSWVYPTGLSPARLQHRHRHRKAFRYHFSFNSSYS